MTKDSPWVDWELFPDFKAVEPLMTAELAIPFFQNLIQSTLEKFKASEANFEPTWESTVKQLTYLENDMSKAYTILSIYNGVRNSSEIRKIMEKVQPEYIKLSLLMGQSEPRYKALLALKSNTDYWAHLDPTQRRVVDKEIRSMKNAGVGFSDESIEKKRFNELSERLSKLKLDFSNNVLDSTKDYQLHILNKEELDGCPDTLLESMRKGALEAGHQEGYCITLDFPTYSAFMKNCTNITLREKVYRASISKASSGNWDNEPIINETLRLKHEKALLLGYSSFADFSLSVKMADNVASAEELICKLFNASIEPARKELQTLSEFASNELGIPSLSPWDMAYVSEKYRKSCFKYDDEAISEYFAFPKVLHGLFCVTAKLFGAQVTELSKQEQVRQHISVWHEDVKVFSVAVQGETVAYFYGDFYSRPSEKRGGAWMAPITTRWKHDNGKVTLPVAYLSCNQPKPQSDQVPSLMKFRDVETVFHEFGHCLQHILTRVDHPEASGINGIEWDFVEVASQFNEYFCREPEGIKQLSGHYKTGEAIPNDMVDALVNDSKFLSGLAMLRQLHFSKVDLVLHSSYLPPQTAGDPTIFDIDARIANEMLVTPRIPEDKFLCSFSHIFAGGYSAGYYSYKWSETYAADAYAAFEEALLKGGESAVIEMGQLYRDTVLSLGGGTAPQQVWEQFRQRSEVDILALLRHSGLS